MQAVPLYFEVKILLFKCIITDCILVNNYAKKMLSRSVRLLKGARSQDRMG